MALVTVQFQMDKTVSLVNLDLHHNDEQDVLKAKDNIVTNLVSGNSMLTDISYFDGHIDGDDETPDTPPVPALFVDVLMDVDDDYLSDYSHHAKEITDLAVDAIQDETMYVSHQWQRDDEEHIGFMAIYP